MFVKKCFNFRSATKFGKDFVFCKPLIGFFDKKDDLDEIPHSV